MQLATRALSRPVYVLTSLVVVSTLVRAGVAWRHSTPRYFPDEYLYMQLGRSLGHGHLMVRDHTASFPAVLEPLLAAPLWRLFPLETAYHLVQAENAFALSLAAIPVYLIARYVGLDPVYALLCSLYSVVVPTTVMAAFTVTDFIAYPLALGALAAAIRALETPTARRQLLFIGFMALATAARTQYFVLAPAYVAAAVLLDGRGAVRRHKTAMLAFAPAAIGVAVAATGYFASWFSNIPLGWRDLSQPALQVFLLTLASGVVLVPGAVVGLWRPSDRRTRTFALMAGSFVLLSILEISVFSANTVRFKERYLISVLPLIAIGFGIYRKRGYPHRWPVFLMCAALAIVASRLPISAYATGADRFDSETLSGMEWLQSTLGVASASFLIAAILTAGGIWAVATAALKRGALSLPLAVAMMATVTAIATHDDLRTTRTVRAQQLPADVQWMDHASGGRPITAIATPLSSGANLELQLFWNPDVRRVVTLDDADEPDLYADEPLVVGANGALKNVRGFFFFDDHGSRATFTDAERVASAGGQSVWKSAGVPHFRALVEGVQPDGWLIAGGRIRAWPVPSQIRSSRARLSFTASVPSTWPGTAVLRIGSKRWLVRPSQPIRISCTAGRHALDITYRSPSTIFNRQGNPASVRMTRISVSDVPATPAGRTSCVRVG